VNFRFVSALTFIFLFVLAVSSCKKRNDNVFLANETTQGFDGYSYTDTFKLLTRTVREDSIKSDSLSHNLIGVINDADFGKYTASSYFQFRLPQLNNVINTQKLDSAVLIMQYTSATAWYGDLNTNMAFDVVEVNELMDKTRTHSNQSYSYNPTPIGSFSGKFRPSDSISVRELGKKVKIAPSISIKLDSNFAKKLFNANTELGSQENFVSFFKGLGIIPTSNPSLGSGAIAAFNMTGGFSKIRIYYNDSLQSDFKVIPIDSRRLSNYTVNNQPVNITKQKSAQAKASFDTTYAQAMTGAKTHIRIPYLFGLVNKASGKKISVGKAEIIIRPMAGTFASPFTPPTRMLILQPDATTNRNAGIIDLIERSYGGDYNASKNEYRFNITRHIQSLFSDYQLHGKDNNRGLFLTIPSDFPIAPSRIVMDMRKGIPNAGIEFKLIYTEL
jgi:hypothetical protein